MAQTAKVVVKEELSLGSICLPDKKVASIRLLELQNLDVGGGAGKEAAGRMPVWKRVGEDASLWVLMSMLWMRTACFKYNSVAKQKKIGVKKPGCRATMSECGFHQAREVISGLRINGSGLTTTTSTLQKGEFLSFQNMASTEEEGGRPRFMEWSLLLQPATALRSSGGVEEADVRFRGRLGEER
ncbi:hypothetical protein KSP40_PGU019920 [Platanthera guangdongensis]|uniref:Uncharacterized protein n=1 Tax=Platanthera guangdongensis TaxID=2320717 RepID=A0ABR2M551_9ASPA